MEESKMSYEIIKRTFEALNFKKDSETRKKLNTNVITSEYGKSKKYALITKKGNRTISITCFSNKKQIIEKIFEKKA